MAVQAALIGLGQIGTSFGLALGKHKTPIKRIGHDLENGIARQAAKKGAVDKTSFNLPGTVRGADFVVLSIPIDQVRSTLEAIAQDLREHCVVFDTSPIKRPVLEWAKEILPPNRYYIGLTPVINGQYLQNAEAGIEAAHEDLFKNGLFAIISPYGTPERALSLATDLAALVGADHMFLDSMEMDSMMAKLHLLPQLSAAALVQATILQPGWTDARKLTGRNFARQVQAASSADEPAALAAASIFAREDSLRVIDNLLDALYEIRECIQEGDVEDLTAQLEENREAHLAWLGERFVGQWMAREMASKSTDMPGAGEVFGRMIGLRPKDKDKKKDNPSSKKR
jgi:prephenate dehydrogenase